MTCTTVVQLPSGWITADRLEVAFSCTRPPCTGDAIEFRIPSGAKLLVDAIARLLSAVNQHAVLGWHVTLMFEGQTNPALTYLSRVGFFRLLLPTVHILPERPDAAEAEALVGNNSNLVEFRAIVPGDRDSVAGVPTLLANSLSLATTGRADHGALIQAAFTIFGELIDNVYDHSQTELVACAALQVYANSGRARVVVSDSGVGLLHNLWC